MIDIQPILSISCIHYTIDGTSSFPITWYFHTPNVHKFSPFFLVNTNCNAQIKNDWQWSVYRKYLVYSQSGIPYLHCSQRELKLKAVLKVEFIVAPLVPTRLLGELRLCLTKLLSIKKDFNCLTSIILYKQMSQYL